MMRHSGRQPGCARGFSLIELAVVLVIIGLLVGGGIAAFDATVTQSRRSEQNGQLADVREALYGFAMSQGRLPCPDTDDPPNGEENAPCDSGPPGTVGGVLPWATLGLGRRDSWGQPLRYRVDRDFAGPAPVGGSTFDLATNAALSVVDGEGESIVSVSPSGAPAVVVSFGPQGTQVWGRALPCSVTSPPAGFSVDEAENCDDDSEFVDAGYRDAEAIDGRFDDQLIWLPASVLKSRMVEAGRLP